MKNEPCVRLGMRISPKMSENPAARRNSNPPKVTLFTASSSHMSRRPLATRHCGTFFAGPTPLPTLPLKGGGDFSYRNTEPPLHLRGRVGEGGRSDHAMPSPLQRRK